MQIPVSVKIKCPTHGKITVGDVQRMGSALLLTVTV